MLEVQGIFPTHNRFEVKPFMSLISTGDGTFLAFLIIKLEHFAQLLVVIRITKTSQRIAIPQEAIALVGHDEWHGYLGIVLEKFLVLTFIIEFIRLMLTQSIESLIRRRFEYLTHGVLLLAFHFYRGKRLASPLVFRQDDIALQVGKFHLTRGLVHNGLHLRSDDGNGLFCIFHREGSLFFLWHDNQTFSVRELVFGSGRYTNQLVPHHLQAYLAYIRRLLLVDIHDNAIGQLLNISTTA